MAHITGQHATAAAILVATLAHAGQVDKAGNPYIDHPRAVAGLLVDPSDEQLTVAWLHDVVEDTDVTLEAIEQTFGPRIAAGVDAITRREGESPAEYYARVRTNDLALAVKDADIANNLDPARLALLDDATVRRLQAKYAKARRHLHPTAPASC